MLLCKKLKLPEESFCTHRLQKLVGFLCCGSKTKITDNSERFLDITLIGHLLLPMLSGRTCKELIISSSQNEKCAHCALLISCCNFFFYSRKNKPEVVLLFPPINQYPDSNKSSTGHKNWLHVSHQKGQARTECLRMLFVTYWAPFLAKTIILLRLVLLIGTKDRS